MAKTIDIEVSESEQALKGLLYKQSSMLKHSRVKALLLIKQGKVRYSRDLAKKLKYERRTIYNWLKTYKASGISGLLKVDRGGNNTPVIPQGIKAIIAQQLNKSDTTITGYKELMHWLEHAHNYSIKYTTLYSYCRTHLQSKLKVARKSHHKKDQGAIEAFKKTSRSTKSHHYYS